MVLCGQPLQGQAAVMALMEMVAAVEVAEADVPAGSAFQAQAMVAAAVVAAAKAGVVPLPAQEAAAPLAL